MIEFLVLAYFQLMIRPVVRKYIFSVAYFILSCEKFFRENKIFVQCPNVLSGY